MRCKTLFQALGTRFPAFELPGCEISLRRQPATRFTRTTEQRYHSAKKEGVCLMPFSMPP